MIISSREKKRIIKIDSLSKNLKVFYFYICIFNEGYPFKKNTIVLRTLSFLQAVKKKLCPLRPLGSTLLKVGKMVNTLHCIR